MSFPTESHGIYYGSPLSVSLLGLRARGRDSLMFLEEEASPTITILYLRFSRLVVTRLMLKDWNSLPPLHSRRMLATSAPIVSSACHGSPRLARLTGWTIITTAQIM